MEVKTSYSNVKKYLSFMKMPAALESLDHVLDIGQKEQQLFIEILENLLEKEYHARFERRLRINFQLSKLPYKERIEQFQFTEHMPKQSIMDLFTLRFLHQGQNVILLGPCGVGKTHIAISLAVSILETGKSAYFLSLHDFVTKATSYRERKQLDVFIRNILRCDVFVIDELGFLSLAEEDAVLLFDIINKRYIKNQSIIVTSNLNISQWSDVFPNEVMCIALVDRLLHRSHVITINTESYRLKQKKIENERGKM